MIEGDLTVVKVRPRRCGSPMHRGLSSAEDGRHVAVHVAHGSFERVHHVDVDEGPAEVVVTAWVGILPQFAEGRHVATMEQRLWFRDVALSTPMGSRTLRDGAPEAS